MYQLHSTLANYKINAAQFDNTHTNNTPQTHKKETKQKLNMLPKICFTDLFYLLCTLIMALTMVVMIIVMVQGGSNMTGTDCV